MQVLWDTISSSFKGRGDVINWDIITCTSNLHISRQVDFSAVKRMDGMTARRRTVCGRSIQDTRFIRINRVGNIWGIFHLEFQTRFSNLTFRARLGKLETRSEWKMRYSPKLLNLSFYFISLLEPGYESEMSEKTTVVDEPQICRNSQSRELEFFCRLQFNTFNIFWQLWLRWLIVDIFSCKVTEKQFPDPLILVFKEALYRLFEI